MKKPILLIIATAMLLTMFLSACGSSVTPEAAITATDTATAVPTITITPTPDLCAPENIRAEVDKIHRYFREFEDAARLAEHKPQAQVSEDIANLQKIRRDAADELVPDCLAKLKSYQIQYMNLAIDALLTFMSATDQQALDQSLAIAAEAREQYAQYTLELARILGIPIVTATAAASPSETPTP